MDSSDVFLDSIHYLMKTENFTEQGDIIRSLKGTNLIIIDSLSALYRLEYSDNKEKGSERPAKQIAEALEKAKASGVWLTSFGL